MHEGECAPNEILNVHGSAPQGFCESASRRFRLVVGRYVCESASVSGGMNVRVDAGTCDAPTHV